MLSEPVKALFEANTNARHAGDADRLAKEHKPNGVHVLTDLPYGSDQLRKLDLYRPETQHEPLPVIIDFHGGGLYHGDKQNTMCRDMYLAKYGFAVVNANYRHVPQIRDSKANYTMRLTQLSGRMSTRMTMAWIRMLCF